MIRASRMVLLFVAAWSFVTFAAAQVATGVPPFSSAAGGPDQINLGNLNVHFAVPVFSKPGRGIPFSYTLSYDSSVWYNPGTSWQPVLNWGWRGQSEALNKVGYVSFAQGQIKCFDDGPWYWRQKYTNYQYHDSFGVAHGFGAWAITTCVTDPGTHTATATDGSGLTMHAFAGGATLTTSGGETLKPPNGGPSGNAQAQDANGNEVNVSGSNFIDTLGTTALSVSGGAPNPLVFTYSDSSGAARQVTVNYSTYTIKTNFGCAGISEYGPTSVSLVSSISLPDGSSYIFHYEATPGFSGDFTGRIASIQLRTGGTITYVYGDGTSPSPPTPASTGMVCSDGSTAQIIRTTSDGSTQYSRSGSGSTWTTTVTDASSAHNQTTINFQTAGTLPVNFYETKRTAYAGAVGGSVLRTVYTCYNGAAADCSSTAISLPISRVTVTNQLDNGQQSKVDTFYNSTYQLVTEADEYDFGGTLLRKTLTNYAALGNGINDRVSSVTVQNGVGSQVAYTSYGYDESGANPTSGVPQHVAVSGSRGNLTSINRWLNNPAGALTTSMTYDDTGNVLSVKDPGAHTTSFSYTDNFSDHVNRNTLAYLTTATLPQTNSPGAANHVTTAQYDVNTGVAVDSADQNGNHTTYSYDAMLRPLQVNYPDGGKTAYTYYYVSGALQQIWTWSYFSATGYTDFRRHVDAVGRIDRTAYWNAQGSWDMQDTCFNANGQVGFISYPYQNANGWGIPSVCSGAGDTYTYDGLGRPTSVAHSDASSVNYAYSGRATQVQEESNGSYNVTRITQSDGLGRLSQVCEVSSVALMGGTSGTPAPCGLDYGGTGFLSTYGYDTLDNLTHVDQGSYATRTYGYDSLSRMTSESFPEQFGCTTTYNYNNDSLLASRVRPAPNQGSCSTTVTTTYAYDELHRLRTRSYSDGSTPTATFNYDESTTWGVGTSNATGRLTSAGISNAAEIFPGADVMGRILGSYQCTPRTCGSGSYNHVYSYDYLGDVTSFNDAGLYTLTEGYNSAARLTSVTSNLVDAQHPATIINNVSYGAFGISSDSLGNGINESFGYNARGALNSYSAGSAYSFTLGLASDSNITTANDSVNGNWSYGYDQFDRIASASKTGVSLTWAYDRFGNRWQQNGSGGPTPQYTIDTDNHISGSGVVYDVLGNVTNDGVGHSFTYDAENRVINANGTAYVYDAFGRRVKNGGYEFLYDLDGDAVTLLGAGDGGWAFGEIYAGGRHLATYSGGTTNFLHTDWLGTKRAMSSVSGTQSMTCTGLPFGEADSCATSWNFNSFTDDFHDSESNTEHTLFRQLSTTQGRWLSSDPAGMGAVDLGNPQSLNRYAYVLDNPLNSTDPDGLCPAPGVDAGHCVYVQYWGPSSFNYGCTIDGASAPCSLGATLIDSGAAAICPDGDCNLIRTGPDGQFQVWVPGSSSGVQENHHGAVEWVMKITTGYWTDDERLHAMIMDPEQRLMIAEMVPPSIGLSQILGRAGEEAVGIVGPKVGFKFAQRTILPDQVTRSVVTEVKNTATQAFTRQLRTYLDFATQTGRRFELYVRSTTQLSGPLKQAILDGLITQRYLPW